MEKNKYSNWRLNELIIEEKKYKKKGTLSSLIIGFLFGVIIFGVAKNGFGFLYIFIPLFLIYGIVKSSQKDKQNLKDVQEAIRAKSQSEL